MDFLLFFLYLQLFWYSSIIAKVEDEAAGSAETLVTSFTLSLKTETRMIKDHA
jgi:hypothetical protein